MKKQQELITYIAAGTACAIIGGILGGPIGAIIGAIIGMITIAVVFTIEDIIDQKKLSKTVNNTNNISLVINGSTKSIKNNLNNNLNNTNTKGQETKLNVEKTEMTPAARAEIQPSGFFSSFSRWLGSIFESEPKVKPNAVAEFNDFPSAWKSKQL
jgi:hypothetical protein